MSDTPAVKLTKGQRETLGHKRFTRNLLYGTVWTSDPQGYSVRVGSRSFQRLVDLELVERVSAAVTTEKFALSDKGRALLDALKEEGEASHGAS